MVALKTVNLRGDALRFAALAVACLLSAAFFFRPAAAEAAFGCFCPATNGACGPASSQFGHGHDIQLAATDEADCKAKCPKPDWIHLAAGTTWEPWVSTDVTEGSFGTGHLAMLQAGISPYKVVGNACQRMYPDDTYVGVPYDCYCKFPTGSTTQSGLDCGERMTRLSLVLAIKEFNWNMTGSAAVQQCRDLCKSGWDFVGAGASFSTAYAKLVPQVESDKDPSYRPPCNYESTFSNNKVFCAEEMERPNDCAATMCVCNYPAGFATAACQRKTYYLDGWVIDESMCRQRCKAAGLEYKALDMTSATYFGGGTLAMKKAKYCNWPNTENFQFCGRPWWCPGNMTDAEGQAVVDREKAEAAGRAVATKRAASMGSSLALNLPLGDIKATTLIGRIIGSILGIVGSIALLMFVYGGITWMTARGDEKRASSGKAIVTWATLGIIAIFSAYAVIKLVTSTLSG
jgi:hypothetical protein